MKILKLTFALYFLLNSAVWTSHSTEYVAQFEQIRFSSIWNQAQKKLATNAQVQSRFTEFTASQWTELESYYRKAAEAYEGPLKDIMFGIQRTYPGTILIFPDLKSPLRSAEKVIQDYGGDLSKLQDIARATIVFKDLTNGHGEAFTKSLKEGVIMNFGNTKMTITRVKNRLHEVTKDILFRGTVILADEEPFPIEIQLATNDSIILKSYAHFLYKQVRAIEVKIRILEHLGVLDTKQEKSLASLRKKLVKLQIHSDYIQKKAERLIAQAKGRGDNVVIDEEEFNQLLKKRKIINLSSG